jgi:hypothetical protein
MLLGIQVPQDVKDHVRSALVVASERGVAQTVCMQACRRCTYRVVGPFDESFLGNSPTHWLREEP